MSVLTLDRTDFRGKTLPRVEEGRFIMVKGTVHHENMTIEKFYATDNIVSKYTKQ